MRIAIAPTGFLIRAGRPYGVGSTGLTLRVTQWRKVTETPMIELKGIGHVNLRIDDEQVSKRFFRDVLGFVVAEEDPEHGHRVYDIG
jgi:hypothetical protein